MNKNYVRLWKVPFLLAALTVFGLLAALLGTGAWHWLSWSALLIPVVVFSRYIIKPKAR